MRRVAILMLVIVAPLAAQARPRIVGQLRLIADGRSPVAGAGTTFVSVRLDGGAAALAAHGIAVRAGAGDVVYARVTVAELRRIAELPSVRSIEPGLRLWPALDRSVAATGLPARRADLGLDGRGVVVGVVDTGCDFRHRDLRDGGGATRLAALLDVAHPSDGRHPELPSYGGGAVWLRDEIDAQLTADALHMTPLAPVLERDIDGHGTNVIGIAAANGFATGRGFPSGRYVGMAPNATLIAVAAGRDGHTFSEDDVVSGLRFVLDRAAALGLPAVVNLSLSAEGGPHDGTSNFERAIDALFPDDAPGRAVVIAGGNGGGRDQHAGGFQLDGPVEVRVLLPDPGPPDGALTIDLWYSDPSLSITVVAPDGTAFGPVAGGASRAGSPSASEGNVTVDNASRGVDPGSGRYDAYVRVVGTHGRAPDGGTWRLVLDGRTARWDAYLTGVTGGGTLPRFVDHLDVDGRATTPAFAHHAISVGSFVSRNQWVNISGVNVTRASVVGRPSSFTATGPTSDGRFLPDLLAPGEFITASLSADALPSTEGTSFFVAGDPSYLWADDGVHALLRGTSQAAPHVTGAVALLFQVDPTLSPRRLRELLRTSAAVEPGAPGYSPRGGFGHLDVARAVRLLGRAAVGAVDPDRSSVGVARDLLPPGDGRVAITVVPRDATGAPLGPGHQVTVEAADARAGTLLRARFDAAVSDAGEGRYERVLVAEGPRGTAFTVAVTVDGVPLSAHPTVWLVAERSEIGRPFTARGGCALVGISGISDGSALVFFAVCAALAVGAAARTRGAPGNPRRRRAA